LIATLGCLPHDLDNAACSRFIECAPLASWLPALRLLQAQFALPDGPWERIPKGANALFALGSGIIVKLVPPNWRRQGDKELLVAPLLEGKLSLETPRLIGSGTIDGWVCVISTRLGGTALADVWPDMHIAQKRAIMAQTGQLLRELGAVPFDEDIAIRVDWPAYIDGLKDACMARHRRRNMPDGLIDQVLPYLQAVGEIAPAGRLRFIHMDIHPWNLMAQQTDGNWRLTGVLDFGDAIVGQSDLFELLTPLMFMAQGDANLAHAMLAAYGSVDACSLQRKLAACMLIRPDSDVMFCMDQVPVTGPRETWSEIAAQMFPV